MRLRVSVNHRQVIVVGVVVVRRHAAAFLLRSSMGSVLLLEDGAPFSGSQGRRADVFRPIGADREIVA